MKILILGDIFGEPGRNAIQKHLKSLKEKYDADFVIANGENCTHGRGLNLEHYNLLKEAGIDCITLGNHFFSRDDSNYYFLNTPCLIRPFNINPYSSGEGSREFVVNNKKVRVTCLLGVSYMKEVGQVNPFYIIDDFINENKADINIIEYHGEVCSEKLAFANYVDSKVSLVFGTHTHIQTADEQILNGGTGFISDIGMCGPINSIIGSKKEGVIKKYKGLPSKFEVADGPCMLCGIICEFDDNTNKIIKIERIKFIEE